jgi:Na+-transporting methylmalonyl-CoA/oxaloacetate decarboxylase gamma subunit
MSENLIIALQITLIGMSLVFGVIIVLWIVMSLLVRLTTPREKPIEKAAVAPAEVDQTSLKRRAAIAAVSVALAHELTPQLHEFPEPPTSIVSAWQAVQRSRYLTQRALQRRLRR